MSWALAALVGNGVLHRLPALPPAPLVAGLAVVAAALCAVRCLRPVGVAVAFFCLAAVAAAGRLADRLPAASGQIDVELAGWVDDFPRIEPLRTVFTLRTQSVAESRADGSTDAATTPPAMPFRIRLTWYEPPVGIVPGASLNVRVRLRPPRGLSNPGGFDYERWLLTERIGATGYVRSGELDQTTSYGIGQSWLAFRARLADAIAARVDEPTAAALIAALALGVRTAFTDEQWTVLRRTGTTHLVAISGLHIGLVAAFAFAAFLYLQLRLGGGLARHAWPVAAVATLVPAAVYAALAGFELPTVRALLMLAVAQLVILSRRRVAPATGLSLAALVVVAADPFATLGASFWLSFGAVAAIVAGLARHERSSAAAGGALGRARAGLLTLGRLQVVIGIALLPLSAFHFAEVSIAGFFVNLVAVPLFSFVLVPVALLLLAATATGLDAAAAVLASAASPLIGVVWHALVAVADIPQAAVSMPAVSAAAFASAAVGAGIVVLLRSRLRWFGLGGLAALSMRATDRPSPGDFDLTALDVGHGLAVVVRTSRHTLLFDTGPMSRTGFDAGREIVLPALDAVSPHGVDRIVVSHGDSDHAGGLPALRASFADTPVLAGPDLAIADATTCATGQRWVWDSVAFSVLHPATDSPLRGNDGSCVLLIESAGGSALLTGDVEADGERELVAQGVPRVDVLVAPHHGSATSSTDPLVRATQPSYVIVSAAHLNRWNFPRPEVVARWQAVGSVVRSTGDAGALSARISRERATLEGRRETQRRYWAADSGTGGASAL